MSDQAEVIADLKHSLAEAMEENEQLRRSLGKAVRTVQHLREAMLGALARTGPDPPKRKHDDGFVGFS